MSIGKVLKIFTFFVNTSLKSYNCLFYFAFYTVLKEVLFEYERQRFCRINIYTAFYVFQVWAKLIFHFPLQLNRCPQFHTIKGLKSPLLKGGNDAKLCLIQLRCN